MTFIHICNEIQHAARDWKPTVINLIILSRACQDEKNIRVNLIHINIIYF